MAISNLVGTGAIVQAMVPTQTPYLFFKLSEHAGERNDMPVCVEPSADSLTIESQPVDQQIPVGGTAVFSSAFEVPNPCPTSGMERPVSNSLKTVFFTGTKTCTLTVHHPDQIMAGEDDWVVVSSRRIHHHKQAGSP